MADHPGGAGREPPSASWRYPLALLDSPGSERGEHVRAAGRGARERPAVEPIEPETGPVPLLPLEVVHQRPMEVALDGNALGAGAQDRLGLAPDQRSAQGARVV